MRCTQCLMKDILPGSSFNGDGECHWCQTNYPNYQPLGNHRLRERLRSHRRSGAPADCVVGVSGGKDSCYTLYELVSTFGMRCIAFTYHHDGVREFALENARMVCEDLGVSLHVFSLPDQLHLRTFRRFFALWVHQPEPVTAALTCVACKHLHLFGTRLAHRQHIPMVVWANCPLEYPPFVVTRRRSEVVRYLGLVRSSLILANRMIRSPQLTAVLLRHFRTCLEGCLAYTPTSPWLRLRYPSVTPVLFFDYVPWDRERIRETLLAHTRWSPPPETTEDWHSDCLFHVVKEYQYQKLFGVSYLDAFLSNQVRHGLLSREEGLEQLQRVQRQYAKSLPLALKATGLEYLLPLLDPACFEETETNQGIEAGLLEHG